MGKKRVIRITESELKKIVSESVVRILNETRLTPPTRREVNFSGLSSEVCLGNDYPQEVIKIMLRNNINPNTAKYYFEFEIDGYDVMVSMGYFVDDKIDALISDELNEMIYDVIESGNSERANDAIEKSIDERYQENDEYNDYEMGRYEDAVYAEREDEKY
jgi:hypothetical protein